MICAERQLHTWEAFIIQNSSARQTCLLHRSTVTHLRGFYTPKLKRQTHSSFAPFDSYTLEKLLYSKTQAPGEIVLCAVQQLHTWDVSIRPNPEREESWWFKTRATHTATMPEPSCHWGGSRLGWRFPLRGGACTTHFPEISFLHLHLNITLNGLVWREIKKTYPQSWLNGSLSRETAAISSNLDSFSGNFDTPSHTTRLTRERMKLWRKICLVIYDC